MTADTIMFLGIRVLHVVLAGIWLGAAFFTTVFLGPAMHQGGPAAGPVMNALVRRGLVPFMAALGGTTVLTGIYLFWRFTGGFDPAISAGRAGMAFSVGALAGVIALILGGSVIGRSAKKVAALSERAASTPESQRGALMAEMDVLRARMAAVGRIEIVLLLFAMSAMALGHYIG